MERTKAFITWSPQIQLGPKRRDSSVSCCQQDSSQIWELCYYLYLADKSACEIKLSKGVCPLFTTDFQKMGLRV